MRFGSYFAGAYFKISSGISIGLNGGYTF